MYHGRVCQANALFDVKYVVQVPYYAITKPEDLQHYGVVGHYDKKELNALIAAETVAKMPLSQMAELVAAGIPVRLMMPAEEIKTAYNAIIEHLENWIYIGDNIGYWNLPPLDDLLAFDELAEYLYTLVEFDGSQPQGLTDTFNIHQHILETPAIRQKPKYQPYSDYLIDKMTQGIYREKQRRGGFL